MKRVTFAGDEKKKVIIMGANEWSTVIARIIGKNVLKSECFNNTVQLYCYEEVPDGKSLHAIINDEGENVRHLPGFKLPTNVVAVAEMEAAYDADVIIWALPASVTKNFATLLADSPKSAIVLSLVEEFHVHEGGDVALISEVLQQTLNIEVSVMMGANLAGEVASEKFCEATIGCRNKETGQLLKNLMQTDYFRISVVDDIPTIEVCGALKNIVAVGAGIVDGLEFGDNTKAAVMRHGLKEMIKYSQTFYPGSKMETFFESCGVADLNATCYGGRSRKVAEAFVRTGKSLEELEKDMLNGQDMQGPQTAEEVYIMLNTKGLTEKFPLFVAIHRICIGELPPKNLIDCIRCHPEHL